MAITKTFQESYVSSAKLLLDSFIPPNLSLDQRNKYRLSILERCAASIGGFDYHTYCKAINVPKNRSISKYQIDALEKKIKSLNLEPNLVLSILSEEDRNQYDQRKNGAYYTDYRLAKCLSAEFDSLCKKRTLPKVIDLSSGCGILLNSVALELSKKFAFDDILKTSIYGIDLSENALRGSLLSLSSLTKSIIVIKSLKKHLVQLDSLSSGQPFFSKYAPYGFDGIIGNPPWEKLKISLHEYLKSNGHERHYGQRTNNKSPKELDDIKEKIKNYINTIKNLIPESRTEVDLYMPFLTLALKLTKPNGIIAQLLPASLIRNQGSELLRKNLINSTSDMNFTILDNKGKFFSIDSRFKFLLLRATLSNKKQYFNLSHGKIIDSRLEVKDKVEIKKEDIAKIRPDLSLPEVRTQAEWELFKKISFNHKCFGEKDSVWSHSYSREIDMTLDKKHFRKFKSGNFIPVIEGRMVHQFRTGVKSYVSGSGRRAIWREELNLINGNFKSQFYIDLNSILLKQRNRIFRNRAAFCDITGQTNERTMLSTIVVPGCICGNKVPTIDFNFEDEFPCLPYVWIGLSNSFVYDWLLRRIITTNANFFIIDSVPTPTPDFQNPLFNEISELSQKLINSPNFWDWETAILRARIDALAAVAFNITFDEYEKILEDFVSLDKLQPSFENEDKCTITKNLALCEYLQIVKPDSNDLKINRLRVTEYRKIGAVAYVPSQFIHLSIDKEKLSNGVDSTRKACKGLLPTGSNRGYSKISEKV